MLGDRERPTTTDLLLATRRCPRHSPLFDSLLKPLTLKNSLHEDAWRMNHFRIQFSRLNQMFDFGDRYLGRSCHHRIKIARGLPIYEISPAVAFPGLDERKVGLQPPLQDVGTPVELACFFTLGNQSSHSRRRKEGRNPRSRGANTLRKCPLWTKIELHCSIQHHLFQQFIFADVSSDVPLDLTIRQQHAHAKTVYASVITDGREILDAFFSECANQVFRHAAQTEAAHHNGRSVEHVMDSLFSACDNFMHDSREFYRKLTRVEPS